jgi:hypothetical protein
MPISSDYFLVHTPPEFIVEIEKYLNKSGLFQHYINLYNKQARPLKPDEIGAISIKKPRTAALCFDRVWYPFGGNEINDIYFCGNTTYEQYVFSLRCLLYEIVGAGFLDDNLKPLNSDGQVIARILSIILPEFLCLETEDFTECFHVKGTITLDNIIVRNIRREYYAKHNLDIIPVYSSKIAYHAEYPMKNGSRDALLLTLNDLNIVDEESLSWEQVKEFRKDKDNRKLYRNLLHWMDKDLLGKPQSFIEDEFSIKLENYENALRKYSIRTILGAISEILDGKFILSAAGLAAAGSLLGSTTLGILAASAFSIGRVAIKATEMFIDLDTTEKGPDSEIAWIYEAKNELKSKRSKRK